jgi:cystathionine beta-lyase/cystathionine gamma-synthase
MSKGSKGSKKQVKPKSLDTIAVHSSDAMDFNAGAVVAPIYQTSTFNYPDEYSEAREKGVVHLYTRLGNPTLSLAAKTVAEFEGAEKGRVFSSGMAAISTAMLALLKEGDEIVALDELYGSSIAILRDYLPHWGVNVKWVPAGQSNKIMDIVTDRTKLLHMETPTNPTLRVHDIALWSMAAKSVGAALMVDNTFATPINQKPIDLGADLVVHSATKYLGGHSDLVAGVLVGSEKLFEPVDNMAACLGGVLDPMGAFLLTRGMKTLGLRVRRHNENGKAVSEDLEGHPRLDRIHFPGRYSRDEERIAARQMKGRGGMLTLELKGGVKAAHKFMHKLDLFHSATSLGSVGSLVCLPLETSHHQLSPEERASRGIVDGMVRLSLGIEDPADLIADIRRALSSL